MERSERETVTQLQESLDNLLNYDNERLYSRDEWGSKVNFHDFKSDFDRLFGLANIFQDLPFGLLPDEQLTDINNCITEASNHLDNIDTLDVSTANNAQQTVQNLGDQVKNHADAVTVKVAPWVSYLAYQKGDVSQNLAKLEGAISDGEALIEQAKQRIKTDEENIKSIVQQAQDFSGDKGVTVFTEQFNSEASQNADEARKWLISTASILAITLALLVIFIIRLAGVTNLYEWLPRAALIGILVTAGLWCGKNYRIIRHHQTVNHHKANGLKSFLLFRDAADNDEGTRNSVLLETTKAIFSAPDSGFVPSHSQSTASEINVVDSTKAAAAAASVARGRAASE